MNRSRTLGIDLASQAKQTAVCVIDWSTQPAQVLDQEPRPLGDDVLIELICDERIGKVGVDAPFGWPLAFIDALTTHRDTGAWLALPQEELRFRATEKVVQAETGQAPLSVATSDLAWPAMRCARILEAVSHLIGPVNRSGSGSVAEVYPAAALRRWEVIPPGTSVAAAAYKGSKPGRRERREELMRRFVQRLDGVVDLSAEAVEVCIADDDDLDAFVSALVARAVQIELVDPIPAGSGWVALREGWIHVPVPGSLTELASGTGVANGAQRSPRGLSGRHGLRLG